MKRLSGPAGCLAAAVVVYFAAVSWWCLRLHGALRTGVFDLGIHAQSLWLLSRGQEAWLNTRGLPLLADHFLPILYALAPLYRLVGSPSALLVGQTLALALGAVPLYALARQQLGCPRQALGWALCYLLHPALLGANLYEFHTSTLATPLLLTALWALHSRRLAIYALCLPLIAACGEALALSVMALAWEPWRLGRRRLALTTLLMGGAAAGLARTAMARASGGAPTQYASLYGAGLPHDAGVMVYPLLLLVPLLGLPLLGWRGLLPALPVILGNLLSWRDNQRNFDNHYQAAVLPFLLWASVLAWPRLRGRVRLGWLAALLGTLALAGNSDRLVRALPQRTLPQVAAAERASADNGLGAHLADRDGCFLFPNPMWPCCWGNRPESLQETAGWQCPPEPGEFWRALGSCALDRIVLQAVPDSAWPLSDADRAYLVRLLDACPTWKRSGTGELMSWQRGGSCDPAPLGWSQLHLTWSGDSRTLAWESAGNDARLHPRGRVERYSLCFWNPGSPQLSTPALPAGSWIRPSLGRTAAEWAAADRDTGVLWGPAGRLGEGYASTAGPAPRLLGRDRLMANRPRGFGRPLQAGGAWIDVGGLPRLVGLAPGNPVGACPAVDGQGEAVWTAPGAGGGWQVQGKGFRLARAGATLEPSLSADGRWLAYTWMQPDGRSDVCLRDLHTGQDRCLTQGADGSTFGPALAPDGSCLAAVTLAPRLGGLSNTAGRVVIWRQGRWSLAAPER